MPETILITGAARGIGRALAERYLAAGDTVVGVDLSPFEYTHPNLKTAIADVTRAEELRKAVEPFGPFDVLIANAGIGYETSALALDGPAFEKVIAVNLVGVANSMAAVLPGMIARKRGHLAAISSLASFGGIPKILAYSAAKSGVNALMEGARAELRQSGITTSIICPGWIRTAMTADIAHQLPDIIELDDAAARIHAAIKNRKPFVAFPAWTTFKLRILSCLPTSWRDHLLVTMLKPAETTKLLTPNESASK